MNYIKKYKVDFILFILVCLMTAGIYFFYDNSQGSSLYNQQGNSLSELPEGITRLASVPFGLTDMNEFEVFSLEGQYSQYYFVVEQGTAALYSKFIVTDEDGHTEIAEGTLQPGEYQLFEVRKGVLIQYYIMMQLEDGIMPEYVDGVVTVYGQE